MQFNNSRNGAVASALVHSLFVAQSKEAEPLPPPTDFYLLDNGGEKLLDNSGKALLTNEYP